MSLIPISLFYTVLCCLNAPPTVLFQVHQTHLHVFNAGSSALSARNLSIIAIPLYLGKFRRFLLAVLANWALSIIDLVSPNFLKLGYAMGSCTEANTA